MQETLIEAKNLSYIYPASLVSKAEKMAAVKDISFTIKRGEILGFLGPNGAGKSTTMRLLSGVLVPASGSIQICGFDLFEQPLQAKNKIGYLPDVPPLYKEFTVDEYLKFCAGIHQIAKSDISSSLNYVKQRCGLEQQGKRIISHLSKGYQQRVGIAQAIIHQPEIIILDEPTVGLDPIQIYEIRGLIKELGDSHSVLISTHILSEIQEICHTVQIINQGELVLKDSISGLNQRMQSCTLIARFQATPDKDLIESIAGVSELIAQDDGSWFILCEQDTQRIASAIVSLAAKENWALYEIYKQNLSLEKVFMSLTRDKAQTMNPNEKAL